MRVRSLSQQRYQGLLPRFNLRGESVYRPELPFSSRSAVVSYGLISCQSAPTLGER